MVISTSYDEKHRIMEATETQMYVTCFRNDSLVLDCLFLFILIICILFGVHFRCGVLDSTFQPHPFDEIARLVISKAYIFFGYCSICLYLHLCCGCLIFCNVLINIVVLLRFFVISSCAQFRKHILSLCFIYSGWHLIHVKHRSVLF